MALENVDGLPACVQPGLSLDLHRALQLCTQAKRRLEGLAALASTLKFDGLSYLVLNDGTSADCVSVHLTTAGRDWCRSYAKRHYHSIDPRIVGTHGRPSDRLGRGERSDGLSYPTFSRPRQPIRDLQRRRNLAPRCARREGRRRVGFGDKCRRWRAAAVLEPALGTLTLLVGFLHEAMLSQYLPDIGGGARSALSERERGCLGLAANGMTSADVGVKLGITARTATFTSATSCRKLGALNRGEAIARAVARNIRLARALDRVRARQPLAASHSRNSAIECTVASGASRARPSGEWAPYATASARRAGVSRELEIVRRVADHQRLAAARPPRRSIRCSSMSGCGLGNPSSAQRVAWKRVARARSSREPGRGPCASCRLRPRASSRARSSSSRARRAPPNKRNVFLARQIVLPVMRGQLGVRCTGRSGATVRIASAKPSPIT